ncbi:MAG: TetR family transcriptional regulator [Solirubrobacterales bacterium]|nr:TetR family transcriptional regulator [Solirubrobacterales bacterium]MBV9942902.1 TetR family transcriptional regulator [Solirubrobacterales bacterium]
MSGSSRRGRPPRATDARERIRDAAREQFLAGGYHAVTMRSIAAQAEVDVALVSYYFGSKQGVFGAAMALPITPAEVIADELEGDMDTFAERLLARVLALWDDPQSGAPLAALASMALGDPKIRQLVSEAISREVVARLAAALDGPEREERASAFCTIISGVVFSRYLLAMEQFTALDADDVVRLMAPSLQPLITREPG